MTLYLNNRRQIEEKTYLRRLLTESSRIGIDAFLFTPEDVDHKRLLIHGIRYDHKNRRWHRSWTEMPDLIFDRCRYQPNERFRQLVEFRNRYPHLKYLNRPLANKWRIHQLFSQNPLISDHLPDTKLFKSGRGLLQFIAMHGVVFLKPVNGTGGRGILRIEELGWAEREARNGTGSRTGSKMNSRKTYLIQGRDNERRIISEQILSARGMINKAISWASGRVYLMQQGIDISLHNGRVHDFRMLIQKNCEGRWKTTGCAGRIGAARSITSNLHGGGTAIDMKSLLKQRFSDDTLIRDIETNAETLAFDIVEQLEREYGRLCELALDLAVDREGNVWLIEINPKPGRNIFLQINDIESYRNAVIRPLEYALWLHKQLQKQTG